MRNIEFENDNNIDYHQIKIISLLTYHRCVYFKVKSLLFISRFNCFKNDLIIKIKEYLNSTILIQYMCRSGINILNLNKHYKSNRQMNIRKINILNTPVIKIIKLI